MSNYLAIATVTATLQRILQASIQEDIPGARVTTVRPDNSGSGTPEVGVNIYLYQATPNPAWRNYDLRTRRPKGELIKQAQAGLDLYYLMTFYGNEVELEPQRLLGSSLRTLVDHPILTPDMIRETVNNSTFSFLASSTLEQQIERVSVVPNSMNTEELSKIWSIFFQAPYVLSFAFMGGAVLIEGNKGSTRALPVRRVEFYTTPNKAMISQILPDTRANQPIDTSTKLTIRGKQLQGENTTLIKIGNGKLTPQKVNESEIQLDLSLLSVEEANSLRAGVQTLQVIHPKLTDLNSAEWEHAFASNVIPFVLCPKILSEVEIINLEYSEEGLYTVDLRIQVDLIVSAEQKVLLFLNERVIFSDISHRKHNLAAYIYRANSRNQDTKNIIFTATNIKAGTYLVRIEIDGAESPLEVQSNSEIEAYDQFIAPAVVIG
jgi:Pvc16 N-terminal domain